MIATLERSEHTYLASKLASSELRINETLKLFFYSNFFESIFMPSIHLYLSRILNAICMYVLYGTYTRYPSLQFSCGKPARTLSSVEVVLVRLVNLFL